MPSHPTPAAERDLFSLAEANISELTEAFDHAMDNDTYEGEQSVPPRVSQISNLVMAETVRLIRQGTRGELAEAGVIVSSSVARRAKKLEEEDKTLESPFDTAFSGQEAASKILGSAIAPSSAGSEPMVLRSMEGLPSKILCHLIDSDGFRDENDLPANFRGPKIAKDIGHGDASAVHIALSELSSAGLVSWTAHGFIFGRRRTKEGEVDEAVALARAYAEAYDQAHEK